MRKCYFATFLLLATDPRATLPPIKSFDAKMWELILQGRCQLRADLLIPFGSPREGGRAGEKRLFTCNVTPAGALEHRNRATDIVFARVGNFLRTSFHGGERAKFRICRGYAADAFARTAASPTLPRDATAPEEFLIKDPNFIPYSKKSLYAYCTKTALFECENLREKREYIQVLIKMSIIAM